MLIHGSIYSLITNNGTGKRLVIVYFLADVSRNLIIQQVK